MWSSVVLSNTVVCCAGLVFFFSFLLLILFFKIKKKKDSDVAQRVREMVKSVGVRKMRRHERRESPEIPLIYRHIESVLIAHSIFSFKC